MNQVMKQLRGAQIREAIVQKEYQNHQTQMAQAEDIQNFLQGTELPVGNQGQHQKTSTVGFYLWMKGALQNLYTNAFQLAFATAKKAEQALQHELGDSSLSYVQSNYMDGMEGLLAGEKMLYDLKRMEMDYHDLNAREYEMTKQVSLLQVFPAGPDPAAGHRELPVKPAREELFDLDGPRALFPPHQVGGGHHSVRDRPLHRGQLHVVLAEQRHPDEFADPGHQATAIPRTTAPSTAPSRRWSRARRRWTAALVSRPTCTTSATCRFEVLGRHPQPVAADAPLRRPPVRLRHDHRRHPASPALHGARRRGLALKPAAVAQPARPRSAPPRPWGLRAPSSPLRHEFPTDWAKFRAAAAAPRPRSRSRSGRSTFPRTGPARSSRASRSRGWEFFAEMARAHGESGQPLGHGRRPDGAGQPRRP